MILDSISTVLRNKLIADSTLVTLVGSTDGVPNIYFGQAPKIAGSSAASLVYNIFGVGEDDVSDKNIDELSINFVVTTLRDGVQNAALQIIDRIDGDGIRQPGHISTYGLRRQVLNLAGLPILTHKMTPLWRETFGPVDSDEPDIFIAYQATYTTRIQTA